MTNVDVHLSVSDLAAVCPTHTSGVPPSRPSPSVRASSSFSQERAVRIAQWAPFSLPPSPQDFFQPAVHGDNFDYFCEFLK